MKQAQYKTYDTQISKRLWNTKIHASQIVLTIYIANPYIQEQKLEEL